MIASCNSVRDKGITNLKNVNALPANCKLIYRNIFLLLTYD